MIKIVKQKICDQCGHMEEIGINHAGNERWFTIGEMYDTVFTEDERVKHESGFVEAYRRVIVPIQEKLDFCSHSCIKKYLQEREEEVDKEKDSFLAIKKHIEDIPWVPSKESADALAKNVVEKLSACSDYAFEHPNCNTHSSGISA